MVTIRDTRANGDGTDMLRGVERARFSDQTIDLLSSSSPEVEGPDLFTTSEDTSITLTQAQMLVNDGDPDGDPISISEIEFSSGGAAVLNDDGFSTAFQTAITIEAADLLGDDSDVGGDALAIDSVGGAVGGTVALDEDGKVVFTSASGFSGTASFTYRVSDGAFQSDAATVERTVGEAGNTPPEGAAVSFTTDEDEALTGNVLANDTDANDDALTLNADGPFTYTPDTDFGGTNSFTYRVDDGTEDGGTAAVTITVPAVNDGGRESPADGRYRGRAG